MTTTGYGSTFSLRFSVHPDARDVSWLVSPAGDRSGRRHVSAKVPTGRSACGIGDATSICIFNKDSHMFATIKTTELETVTGGGGSSGIKNPLSQKPAITGTATPSLVKKLEQIDRPGFDFAIAK
jgi:hypothetical protein